MSRPEDDPLRVVLPELGERWDDRGVQFRARSTRTLLGFVTESSHLMLLFVGFAFFCALGIFLARETWTSGRLDSTTALMVLFGLPLGSAVVFTLISEWVARPLPIRIEAGELRFGREVLSTDGLVSVTRDQDRLRLGFRDGRTWTSPGVLFKDPFRVVHLIRATIPPDDAPTQAEVERELTEKLAALRSQRTEVSR